MATITETEQATNRQRLLLIAGKAGLEPKHLKRIKKILRHYETDAVVESVSLRYGDSCICPTGPRPGSGVCPPRTGHLAEPPTEIL
jgi:hypothetical protein